PSKFQSKLEIEAPRGIGKTSFCRGAPSKRRIFTPKSSTKASSSRVGDHLKVPEPSFTGVADLSSVATTTTSNSAPWVSGLRPRVVPVALCRNDNRLPEGDHRGN